MVPLKSNGALNAGDLYSRREMLLAGSLAGVGLALPKAAMDVLATPPGRSTARSCICLMLVGGPSHLDTFDPKPDAPADVRGPFRPIRTNVPGIDLSEILPRTARQADKFAIVRSLHHPAAPVHDAGLALMQTGRLFEGGIEHPHMGCVVGAIQGSGGGMPAHVILPGRIGHTGGDGRHGQTAGYLGRRHEPFVPDGQEPASGLHAVQRCLADESTSRPPPFEPAATGLAKALDLSEEPAGLRGAYGRNRFGQSCLLARRLIEHGTRFVTVNMFDAVFNRVTWDSHGRAPFCSLDGYRESVAPMFDAAYATLLADLHARGLLADTLVVAMGEFGRTPRINRDGGRDHWPHCGSILFAGGGVRGGRVIGSSDKLGAFPEERPVTPAEVVATVYHRLGIHLEWQLTDEQGRSFPIVEPGTGPIRELF
ncbi:MAG: DUF1501 domain-containing protein [Phycisphaerae bacterium]|jgi:hypothetical protein